MTDAELRALLLDCLALWGLKGRVEAVESGMQISVGTMTLGVERAPVDMRPVRWLLQTPERRAANRPARAIPSIVALLSALRNALGGNAGAALRIGAVPAER